MNGPAAGWTEQELVAFLSTVCHEIRTPVAVLSMATQAADRMDAARARELLVSLEPQVARLRVVIERYLDHGRMQFATRSEEVREVDAAEVVGRTLRRLEALAPSHRVQRDLRPGWVLGDPACLTSIVENLVLNAVQYSADDQPVHVAVRQTGGVVQLVVTDTGIGIPRQELPHLTRPFFRGAAASGIVPDGAGLGLAVVAGHVANLDGALDIDSRPGAGTRVRVAIPSLREGVPGTTTPRSCPGRDQ